MAHFLPPEHVRQVNKLELALSRDAPSLFTQGQEHTYGLWYERYELICLSCSHLNNQL